MKARLAIVGLFAVICLLAVNGIIFGQGIHHIVSTTHGGELWTGDDGGQGVTLVTDFFVEDNDYLDFRDGFDLITFGSGDAAILFDATGDDDIVSYADNPNNGNDLLTVQSDIVMIVSNGGGSNDDSGSVIIQLGL